MKLPRPLARLIESFERLPGIGPKTAQRLTFYLMNFPQEELERFADSLTRLKKETKVCKQCKNVSETEICGVCSDPDRDHNKILVVATVLDAHAIEKAGYKGLYHVLHGVIDPLNNIGPEELYIKDLLSRISVKNPSAKKTLAESSPTELPYDLSFDSPRDLPAVEIILATNSGLEGESTAMYISKLIRSSGFTEDTVKISRIARGLPVGGDIEYADDITLSRALEGRSDYRF